MTDGPLTFRSGYNHDRRSFLALADLLRDTFDIDISRLDRFGGPEPSSMPFAWFDADGRCVANFSAFSLPLVVDGRIVRAAGYQSGAVRPDYRGRGLYGDLMVRAFGWADARGFEAGILLTDKPDLYRRHGFEVVPQHAFRGQVVPKPAKGRSRRLSIDDDTDLALMADLLESRCDLSQRFATRRQTQTFLLNACIDPDIRLSHIPALDTIVAWKTEDGTLRLLDVVTRYMPDIATIVGALGDDGAAVETLFPPDLLGWDGAPVPFSGSCVLMIRPGPEGPVPAGPFMLSPMADF
ncbi:MAG: GNAT family N-acetyltransferase [Rhizobiaceae bacterium]|nr:GNAT family N-acetyltransferase [Rhizobiaceae bacterium]